MDPKLSLNTQLPVIIIPAHNEAKSIVATLDLIHEDQRVCFNVVVVCNGCIDNTADIVRNRYPKVRCEELQTASKALAIRHAESLGLGFPRLYLDADICISAKSIQALFDAAREHADECLVVPVSRLNIDLSTYWVRAYYRIWYQSPRVISQGFGAGAYVLNKAARLRFDDWPELIADDSFVRLLFSSEEIIIVDGAVAIAKAPKYFPELIKVKARVKYGNYELNKYSRDNPGVLCSKTLPSKRLAWLCTLAVKNFLPVCVYIYANIIAQVGAKKMIKYNTFDWLRDESNR